MNLEDPKPDAPLIDRVFSDITAKSGIKVRLSL